MLVPGEKENRVEGQKLEAANTAFNSLTNDENAATARKAIADVHNSA